MFWVPELLPRWKMYFWSVHGATPEASPKPKTRYAAAALIDLCLDPLGTMNPIACTGPGVSTTLGSLLLTS